MSDHDWSPSPTVYFDGKAELQYPCHCGVLHRGEYAAEEWAHHNCLHREGFWHDDVVPEQAICVGCGQAFQLIPLDLPKKGDKK